MDSSLSFLKAILIHISTMSQIFYIKYLIHATGTALLVSVDPWGFIDSFPDLWNIPSFLTFSRIFVVGLNQVLRCDLHFSEILITLFNLILLVTSSWICGTFREIKNIKLFKIIFRQGDFFSNKTNPHPPPPPLLIWFWYEGVLWTKYLKFGGSTMEILKYDCTMMTNYVEIIFIL